MRDEAGRADGLRHIDAALRLATASGNLARVARLEAIQGLYRGDERLFRKAIGRAESSGDALTLAVIAREYGGHLGTLGRYEEAMAYIKQAIELLAAQQERFEHGFILAAEGRCYSSRAGNLQQSLAYAAEGHEIAETLGDARLRAWGAMEAEPYFYQGLWQDVVRAAEAALPVGWKIGEWNAILWSSGWLGIAYLKLGRPDDARRILGRALREVPTRAVGSFPITYPQIALAQLHLAEGDVEQALGAARKALELAEGSRLRLEQGAARRVLGQVHEAARDRVQAEAEFRESLEILEEIQSRPELGQTLLAYGRFTRAEDPAGGRAQIQRALGLFESMGATGWGAEARAALSG
jgi:tetratricopeptide (TPR) repeat protein